MKLKNGRVGRKIKLVATLYSTPLSPLPVRVPDDVIRPGEAVERDGVPSPQLIVALRQ